MTRYSGVVIKWRAEGVTVSCCMLSSLKRFSILSAQTEQLRAADKYDLYVCIMRVENDEHDYQEQGQASLAAHGTSFHAYSS